MIISTLPENFLSAFAQEAGSEVQLQEEDTESTVPETVSSGDVSGSEDATYQSLYDFTGTTMPAHNVIVYADPSTYAVIFVSNGGSVVATQYVVHGNTASESSATTTQSGYIFKG